MTHRLRTFLSGSVVVVGLGALAACSAGGFLGEREPWRKEAEARCIGSGAVREGPGVVRISAINGPGMCGADFPYRVTSLGVPGALSFGNDLRPPASIPNAPRAAPPRWPIAEQPESVGTYEPRGAPRSQVDSRPLPPPPRSTAPQRYDEPISLDLPQAPVRTPVHSEPLDAGPSYDLPSARETRRAAPLGRSHRPRVASTTGTVTVTPKATLACPMVSALDQWIATSVQPSAMRWFGQPVVEIKQISAYSCRGMNGNPRARISEHAFGNALDIASFTLADGRRITVRHGWRGAPEEQGFLRDVQGSACERFTTVLAPGSNVFHYDHMHVDLIRRSGGYRACNPRAVSGEEIAARARARYARGGRDPGFTGSANPRRKSTPSKRLPPMGFADDKIGHQLPLAVPGEDGED
ncbi:MAG: extensin [Rhizobiales bacterium]|nr:extensin [Hyphomicrobiales bacterium]